MSGYRNATRVTATLAGCMLALLVGALAHAQDHAQDEVQTAPPPAEPPPLARPGFFDAIERFLDESKTKIDQQIKGTTDAAKDAAKDVAKGAAKGAADVADQASNVFLGWPGAKVVRGRVRCTVAPNGAPDCAEAANALCRSKGYGVGKSSRCQHGAEVPDLGLAVGPAAARRRVQDRDLCDRRVLPVRIEGRRRWPDA